MTRYHRQTLLPEIGEEGQYRLQKARVLIVGVGGLGCPIATYLCGAGVGHLGLIDDDVVSLSNLHRQVLYNSLAISPPRWPMPMKAMFTLSLALTRGVMPLAGIQNEGMAVAAVSASVRFRNERRDRSSGFMLL